MLANAIRRFQAKFLMVNDGTRKGPDWSRECLEMCMWSAMMPGVVVGPTVVTNCTCVPPDLCREGDAINQGGGGLVWTSCIV